MAATSNSTTVDLSRLAAPIIVEQKTFETIIAEMVAQQLPLVDVECERSELPVTDIR